MTTADSSATEGADENEVDEPAVEEPQEVGEPQEPQEDPADETPQPKRPRLRWIARPGPKVVATVLAVLVVAAASAAGWVYWYQYRPDQQTNDAAAKAAIGAASEGTVALLSYSPDSVDNDFAAAKTHLTGEFLTYYSKFTQQIVAPAAKDKGVKTTATVVQGAASEVHPDSAVVLLFVNQTTTSKGRPEPNMTASSVVVRLAKVNNHWLIAKFDPV